MDFVWTHVSTVLFPCSFFSYVAVTYLMVDRS